MKNNNYACKSITIFPKDYAKSNYTILPHKIRDDKRLSYVERYIMWDIISYSGNKNHVVIKSEIRRRGSIGKSIFKKAWDNLIECGYIIQKRVGHIWTYVIYVDCDSNKETNNDKE